LLSLFGDRPGPTGSTRAQSQSQRNRDENANGLRECRWHRDSLVPSEIVRKVAGTSRMRVHPPNSFHKRDDSQLGEFVYS
jgi:hypothetical protein